MSKEAISENTLEEISYIIRDARDAINDAISDNLDYEKYYIEGSIDVNIKTLDIDTEKIVSQDKERLIIQINEKE